jgi:hypothetical protein
MNIKQLLEWATNKPKFTDVKNYIDFCKYYLSYIFNGLQAVIVSRKEPHYCFYQYNEDGEFNITRPINNNLMLNNENFEQSAKEFIYILGHIKEISNDLKCRELINKVVYSCQQAIGATLDALASGKSNTARKINGDLFERFIRLILRDIGISVNDGNINLPIYDTDNNFLFNMSYQHDLIIKKTGKIVAIGSVKTSSKDRIDKIFIDKLLYNRITNSNTPHFAVFLNDIQRVGTFPNYNVNSTFLSGHFKVYTIKLNPLDGVYYCDMTPIMKSDLILKKEIKTLDCLLVEDIWKFN